MVRRCYGTTVFSSVESGNRVFPADQDAERDAERNAERPRLTTDVVRCKADLQRSGYCLLADALTAADLQEARERLRAQAAAERQLGVAYMDGAADQRWGAFVDADGTARRERFTAAAGGVSQRLFMLLNKGRIFRDIVIDEQALELVRHVLGEHFQLSCSTANIVGTGAAPMELHTDAWWMPPPVPAGAFGLPVGSITRQEAGEARGGAAMIAPPACVNSMWLLVDFHADNGATRVVPGSHLSGRQPKPELYGEEDLVPIEAPAGTAMFFEGRLWHGSGTNRTDEPRMGLLNTYCGPQFRPQENYTLGMLPEVLADAPLLLRELVGFKVWNGYGRFDAPAVEMIDRRQLIGELTHDDGR